jgi:2-desacetyl-2-hydroxyethyl bacteriochlorophyllide A dehydrogenase
MPKKLQLLEPRHLEHVEIEKTPLAHSEVRAEAILSGISHGTEMNLYRGTAPFHEKHFDTELRLFREGRAETNYINYLGYEWVGRITEVGSGVTHLKVGNMVHMPLPHAETHTFVPFDWPNRGRIEPLPSDMDAEQAIFLALAGVALQTVHDARIKTGDRVAVFGLGAIGMLTVQLAKISGASWVDAVDLYPLRRQKAEAFGADVCHDTNAEDVAHAIKTVSHHHGADVAIEVSGHYAALHEAIRSVRKAGTVVAGGYYQGGGTALRFGEEWHHNRITLISSMAVWDCPHRDYPLWDRERIHATVSDLMTDGRLQTNGLITHRIPFSEAHKAYELIDNQPEETIKVVLTY